MSSLPLRRVSDNPRVTRSRDSSQPPSSAVLDDAAHKFSFPNFGLSMEQQRRSAQVKPIRYVEQLTQYLAWGIASSRSMGIGERQDSHAP